MPGILLNFRQKLTILYKNVTDVRAYNYTCIYPIAKQFVIKIKDDFHHLIDSINDEQLLHHYYELIQGTGRNQNGRLWDNLTEDEKGELLIAYDESFENNNLLTHEQVKLQHAEWLKP